VPAIDNGITETESTIAINNQTRRCRGIGAVFADGTRVCDAPIVAPVDDSPARIDLTSNERFLLLQFDSPRHEAGARDTMFDSERSDQAAIGTGSSQRGSIEDRPEGVGLCRDSVFETRTGDSRAVSL
jgi:hypothetical protein